ncbi:hypothetical protein SRHO_G00305930 [Serrasalmus rhombeus]
MQTKPERSPKQFGIVFHKQPNYCSSSNRDQAKVTHQPLAPPAVVTNTSQSNRSNRGRRTPRSPFPDSPPLAYLSLTSAEAAVRQHTATDCAVKDKQLVSFPTTINNLIFLQLSQERRQSSDATISNSGGGGEKDCKYNP